MHAVTTVVMLVTGCTSEPNDTDTDSAEPTPEWTTELEGLSGVLLSIWGNDSSDIWVSGAGPTVQHFDGESWTALDPPTSEDLWWVTGHSTTDIWFSGGKGALLHYDRAGSSYTEIDTGVTATLFGTWTPDGQTVYSVGGHVTDKGAPAVIRTVDGVAEDLLSELPSSIDLDEAYFKVWGTSTSDVWIIGDEGSVLHYDGTRWSHQVLVDSPRLVTIHGSGDDIVIVGGSINGLVLERDGSSWSDVSPLALPPLMGIYVSSTGAAVASGMTDSIAIRENGVWQVSDPTGVMADWHGAWMDEHGDVYAVGGHFVELSDGALVRYRRSE